MGHLWEVGGSTLILAGSLGPWQEPKFVLMLPAGICYIWQRNGISGQSEEEKEEAKCCIWKTFQVPPEVWAEY